MSKPVVVSGNWHGDTVRIELTRDAVLQMLDDRRTFMHLRLLSESLGEATSELELYISAEWAGMEPAEDDIKTAIKALRRVRGSVEQRLGELASAMEMREYLLARGKGE